MVASKLEPCGCGSPALPHVHPRYADNSIWEPLDLESGRILHTGPGVVAGVSIKKISRSEDGGVVVASVGVVKRIG